MSVSNKILRLSKQLLPTGRAFRVKENSNQERLLRALSISEARLFEDLTSILHSLIPDNNDFTTDDATDWERRLGISSSALVPLADRKLAILRKMASPGRNPARGHYLRIQQELQDAGFNVYVYENNFPTYPTGYTHYNPYILNGNIRSQYQLGDAQLGDFELGYYLNNIVARYILNADDIHFDFGDSMASVFYIGAGPGTLGTYATVSAARETEFRQLVLALKQPQNIAVLFINYI